MARIAGKSGRHTAIPRLRRPDSDRNRVDRRTDGGPVTLEYSTTLMERAFVRLFSDGAFKRAGLPILCYSFGGGR